jgi:DHA1 family bicyclomycin/chloramphenicol resistance-like MFS transporter
MTSETGIHRGHLRLILILGALMAFGPLAIDMYLPAFPAIADHFGASAGAVQGTLAAYFTGIALGQSVVGPLSDRYGRLPPLLIGIAAFVLASFGAAHAPSVEWLTAARFIQALGGCAGIVISRAMVRDLFDEQNSAQVYSLLMLVMGVAPILAPLLGGFFIAHFSWSFIFLFQGSFALVVFLVVWRGLGETLPPAQRHASGFASVLYAYFALTRDRPYVAFTFTNAFISAGMFAYITGASFIFISFFKFSPEQFALLFGFNAAGFIIGAQVNAWLLRRISGRLILAVATSVHLAAAGGLLASSLIVPNAMLPLAAMLFVQLACGGFIGANAVAAAMSRAQNNAGAAAALNGIVQFGMAAFAGAAVGLLNNGTSLPMAAVIFSLSLAATLARLAAR